jgi:histidine ammonia-lyase
MNALKLQPQIETGSQKGTFQETARTSGPLTLNDFKAVTQKGLRVELSEAAKKRMERSHRYLLDRVNRSDQLIYAVNTGFGKFAETRVSNSDLAALQVNLLRSHAVGMGEPLSREQVRGMLLLRAVSLAQGYSGVAVETVQRILDLLNAGIHPRIPCQGSVGASGDLAPLSHLALVLIGEGEAEVDGQWMSGKEALKKKNLKPLTLGPKEGLALINGTQMMTSVGLGTLLRARELLRQANLACAMSLEALRGSTAPFNKNIHAVRPHHGQQAVARDIKFDRFLMHPV